MAVTLGLVLPRHGSFNQALQYFNSQKISRDTKNDYAIS
ncbi:MAG: hypothetical protein ACI9GW_001138 [Halieaceae bacterium]|jgi:hypothetical protein